MSSNNENNKQFLQKNDNPVTTKRITEVVKDYISGISKRDRKRIEQELEQEVDEEEPVKAESIAFRYMPQYDWIEYKPSKEQINWVFPSGITTATSGKWNLGNDGPAFIAEPNAGSEVIIPEEVQDVDFE